MKCRGLGRGGGAERGGGDDDEDDNARRSVPVALSQQQSLADTSRVERRADRKERVRDNVLVSACYDENSSCFYCRDTVAERDSAYYHVDDCADDGDGDDCCCCCCCCCYYYYYCGGGDGDGGGHPTDKANVDLNAIDLTAWTTGTHNTRRRKTKPKKC